MEVKNGLYSISIEMRDGKRGHATGVIVLCDGRIQGGDSYFYYTGSYSFKNGRWRGELITHQHTEAVGVNLAFGGREVTCGFTGLGLSFYCSSRVRPNLMYGIDKFVRGK